MKNAFIELQGLVEDLRILAIKAYTPGHRKERRQFRKGMTAVGKLAAKARKEVQKIPKLSSIKPTQIV